MSKAPEGVSRYVVLSKPGERCDVCGCVSGGGRAHVWHVETGNLVAIWCLACAIRLDRERLEKLGIGVGTGGG